VSKKYQISRGSYLDTPDDRLDRWYIEPAKVADRRGPGYRTREEARAALKEIENHERHD